MNKPVSIDEWRHTMREAGHFDMPRWWCPTCDDHVTVTDDHCDQCDGTEVTL